MKISPDHAEVLPLSRANLAYAVGTTSTKIGNWIDQHRLWQSGRSHGYYRLSDAFDLAGFSALRTANMPAKDCARYVYNFGFYGGFLHDPKQLNQFSYRNGDWDLGLFDPSALVSITINMRTMGEAIFQRIAEGAYTKPSEWAQEAFDSFNLLYRELVKLDRLSSGSVTLFEEEHQ